MSDPGGPFREGRQGRRGCSGEAAEVLEMLSAGRWGRTGRSVPARAHSSRGGCARALLALQLPPSFSCRSQDLRDL